MYFLFKCETIGPLIKLLKNGVIPAIQAAIIVVLIVLLIIDLGKAVMAGKEDEIKSAQKLAIKRVVYALVVFLVPWLVNVAIGLIADNTASLNTSTAGDDSESGYGYAQRRSGNALWCWTHPDDKTEQDK